MSVRIYQLSKTLGMKNKDLVALLQERGYGVSSASNTINNIDAEALQNELQNQSGDEEGAQSSGSQESEKKSNDPQAPNSPEQSNGHDVMSEQTKQTVDPGPRPQTEYSSGIGTTVSSQENTSAPKVVKSASEVSKDKPSEGHHKTVKPVVKQPAGTVKPPPSTMPKQGGGKTPPKPIVKNTGAGPAPTPPPKTNHKSAPTPPPATPPQSKPDHTGEETPVAESDSGAEHVEGEEKRLLLKPPIVVREFAGVLGMKPFRLISELMEMGIFASINQTIEEEVAEKIARSHGYTLEVRHRGEQQPQPKETPQEKEKAEQEKEDQNLEARPPVVCVLGHVDHGKTTLLDTIRKSSVVTGEAGGITQHTAAYQVEQDGNKITFIDTPGHAAFSNMRERGAEITDVAVLVVAADDGFMPQTDEALKFAKNSNVPVVVAINKMDTKGANADRVRQQMQERGIAPEEWGGETLSAEVSALEGDGLKNLLEAVLLQAEILEIKANPKKKTEGRVIESRVEAGRGASATAIIEKGTLKIGDALVCGPHYCKVRAMLNEHGERIKEAPPATPVNIMGWSDAPDAGLAFHEVKNEKKAKQEAEENHHQLKRQAVKDNEPEEVTASVDNLLDAIASKKGKTFCVVIKADVQGSAEALKNCLEEIQTDKVKLEVVNTDVGPISKNDIHMSSASDAVVIGFNVKQENGVVPLAKHHGIRIIQHNIIYELIQQVRECMAELLEPIQEEHKLGMAEVRQVFPVAKGAVAGCMVTQGRLRRDMHVRVYRQDEVVHTSKIAGIKRFTEDATEVRAGYECGVRIAQFGRCQEGDLLECFETKFVTPEL